MTPDDAAFPRHAEPGRDTVGALQRALLPATVPVVAGARIAARYLLADDEAGAGGDWYDALALPGGRVALVVGDVVGHGIGATAAMAQLGAILRARLRDGAGPAEAVRCLDRYAAEVPAARASTLCLAVLACGTGELEYHTAGHPPPLLVSGGQARYLPGSGGGPLGTGGPIRFARTRMAPDDLLLLYTDGLVERPGRGAAGSTVELARAAVDATTDGTFEAGLSPDAA
ncbi:MAG TPA: PP2C family protein-serine/threonine phosphatase, partial [Rugosimonospora sp.]|nr:PP2C family protein-serine/threonine phosphatase [Rugosimonospora sp.]